MNYANPSIPRYTPGQYAGMGPTIAAYAPQSQTTYSEDQLRRDQLRLRRQIDDKVRYGRPVSDQEMAEARRIGAVSGGAPAPNYQVSPQAASGIRSNVAY